MKFESVQELFSRTAAEFGPRVAIEHGGRRIAYAELEAESNRLANFLLERGVKNRALVGLLTSDPVRVITGILGVVKAGGVFVPFDPTFPDGRLRTMFQQVNPQLFVTDDTDYSAYDGEHSRMMSDPEAPCSIYFTSGSTGKPKAILGRLKGIDHYMRWEIEAADVGPGTRVSQLASPAFDGFLKDAFVPLCSGGTVCAPEDRSVILSATQLADWLDIEQVEVLHCVPSVFRALLNENLQSRYFEAMKSVVLAGEALYPADVKRWMDVFGDRIR